MAFGPIHKCCKWHFRPSPPDIFWEDEGLWNLMSLQRLSKFMFASHVWYRWKASILGGFFIGWVSVKCGVFCRGVPKLHGSNLVFPWPRWWIPFQTLSPWYLLRRWGSSILVLAFSLLFWANYALAQEVSKFKCLAGVFLGYMGLTWFSLGLGGKFHGHGKGIPFQTLSSWYLLRRWGSLKLDVTAAPFKIYVRITCLVPLKGFHFGSIIDWLSKCQIWSVLQGCSQAAWV